MVRFYGCPSIISIGFHYLIPEGEATLRLTRVAWTVWLISKTGSYHAQESWKPCLQNLYRGSQAHGWNECDLRFEERLSSMRGYKHIAIASCYLVIHRYKPSSYPSHPYPVRNQPTLQTRPTPPFSINTSTTITKSRQTTEFTPENVPFSKDPKRIIYNRERQNPTTPKKKTTS